MTPVIVLASIIVLWAGPGLPGIVTVTFLISFFPIVVNTTQGLLSTDAHLVDLFRTYDATPLQELWRLRLPSAMPYSLAGLRIAATLAPIGAIFGEYLVGNASGGTGACFHGCFKGGLAANTLDFHSRHGVQSQESP